MAVLSKIPREVFRGVFSLLKANDLRTLCLVSEGFRTLAEPFLYEKIHWIWESDLPNPPILAFLRTISQRPDLASLMQVMNLEGCEYKHDLDRLSRPDPRFLAPRADLKDCIASLDGFVSPFRDVLITHLRKMGSLDACIALLLCQLPNLRRLQVDMNFTRIFTLTSRLIRAALCDADQHSLPTFQKLQDIEILYNVVRVGIRDTTNFRNTSDALALFYLPSVEHIATAIDNPITFAWPTTEPPQASTLLSLRLDLVREGHLGRILATTTGLKKLTWDWYYLDDLADDFMTSVIDLDRISADLSHVRETLTDLTITVNPDLVEEDGTLPFIEMKGDYATFKQLTALKNLDVPLPLLLGFSPTDDSIKPLQEVLPPNLEHLAMTDELYYQDDWEWPDECLMQVFRSWLRHCKSFTPRLRGVRLTLDNADCAEWDTETISDLVYLGSKAGIEIDFKKFMAMN